MSSLRINVVPGAQSQIREAVAWWKENRPAAPRAVVQELRAAFRLLRVQPEVGVRPRNAPHPSVRRIHLDRIRYYVYYRLNPQRDVIDVLAFWHTSRGSEPPL